MIMDTQAYEFDREFTIDGEIVSAPGSQHIRRSEAEAMVATARQEGADAKQAEITHSLAQIAAHLQPVKPILSEVCAQLRRDAVELALAAAHTMIEHVLDARATELMSKAIGKQAQNLKAGAQIEVWVAPAHVSAVQQALAGSGVAGESFRFSADPAMKSGDWRIEWDEGAVSFDTQAAMEELADTIRRCLDDPADPQGDLFAGIMASDQGDV